MKEFIRHLTTSIRATPRGIWVLVGGQFINRLGSFVYPFLSMYLTGHGFSLENVSVILASLAAGQFFAPAVGGYLADGIGRRNTIVIALTGGAVTLLAIYASDTLLTLCLSAAAHGFFTFMFGPAANALISDLTPGPQRQVSFSLLRLAINAGFSVGPAIGGVLFGISPGLIFLGDATTTLVFAILAFRYLPHGLRTVEGAVHDPRVALRSWMHAARVALGNWQFVRLYVGNLLMAVAFTQVFTVLQLHAAARGLAPVSYGIVMGFNGFLILLFELVITHISQRFRPQRALVCGYAVTGLGCATFGLAHTFGGFMAAMGFFTLGEMMTLPVASAYASKLAPLELRGRYFGVLGTTWAAAGMIGSVGLPFYGRLDGWWWPIAGGFSLLAAAVALIGFREDAPVSST